MLLAEPQETGADLHFEVAGIRVRVSAWFWVAAVLLGWSGCQWWAGNDQRALVQYLAVWSAVVFVSILVHELGHALAYRFFGQGAHVVLYHFGGLAIPDAWGRRVHLRPAARLLVSAAGPAAQLGLAAGLVAWLVLAGRPVPLPLAALAGALGVEQGEPFAAPLASAACEFLLFVNILWPLLNLVPVPPLDGGQIVREGLLALGVADAPRIAGLVGAAAGGAVAWWGYTRGQPFVGIMFALLAASCLQNLSGPTPWRRWN